MGKPKLLVVTPEIANLPEEMGELAARIGYKVGGLADVKANLVKELHNDPDIEMHLAVPMVKSSLRDISYLNDRHLRHLKKAMLDHNVHMIEGAAFNRIPIVGSNTMLYARDEYFTEIDRAIAFSRGVINYVMPDVEPDLVFPFHKEESNFLYKL